MAGQRGNCTTMRHDNDCMTVAVRVLAHQIIDSWASTLSHFDARLPSGWRPRGIMPPDCACAWVLLIDFGRCHTLPLPQVGFAKAFINFHVQTQLLADELRCHPFA